MKVISLTREDSLIDRIEKNLLLENIMLFLVNIASLFMPLIIFVVLSFGKAQKKYIGAFYLIK